MTWILAVLTVIGVPAAIWGPVYAWLSTAEDHQDGIDFE